MPMPSPPPASAFQDAALVLVGHGSALNANTAQAILDHADELRRRGLFAEVHTAFWKQAPFLDEILDRVAARRVYVVPNLACKGYITQQVIPKAMALTGRVTHRIGAGGPMEITLCDPVGTHPRMSRAIADRARSVIDGHGLDPADTCLLLVGHGNARNGQSSMQTQAVADALAAMGLVADVRTAFLEQDPKVPDWARSTPARNAIVMPFMISNGLHGAVDVPQLLGLDPEHPAMARMAAEGHPAGPYEVDGRRIWYCRAAGCEPAVAEVILDLVSP
ncbi:MAG: hypothetical protein KDE22_10815 [Rhodobacterales bacterium]|nr:hypothetical protein [Rhodobacterales bacterium]